MDVHKAATAAAVDIESSIQQTSWSGPSQQTSHPVGNLIANVASEELHRGDSRLNPKYTIRRPRALQFSFRSNLITAGDKAGALTPAVGEIQHAAHSHSGEGKSAISSYLPEAVAKQRERLDLFIDLIWVGIIGNLSEVYSTLDFKPGGARPGFATMVFILVFLPSWRIWNAMREFWNNYYMDDLTQRLFTFWVLFCSVFYSNQLAYLTEDINQVKQIVISTYLVILGSFLIIEIVYSFYIPWLRRLIAFQTMIRMPSVALWIVAIYLPGIRAIGPIMACTFWEYFCPIVLDSPLAERFTSSEYRKVLDVHHFQSRMANFFVIVLGEGVLQLVKDGPLGFGLNFTTGTMAFALLIYVLLSFLYFNRDGSKNFIPAVKRKGWVILIWVFWHIPLFSAILTFAPSLMFIIRHQADEPYNHTSQERLTQKEIESYTHNALWSVSVSLGIVIASMTALALLDKSLDRQATLKVNNRYVRLGGRFSYFAIIICIPATPKISTNLFLGIGGLLLVFLTMWEWNSSMDKDGKFIEPKGLTMMMSHELKGKHLSSRAQS